MSFPGSYTEMLLIILGWQLRTQEKHTIREFSQDIYDFLVFVESQSK